MGFDQAHKRKAMRKAYLDDLWTARAAAMRLAAKMLEGAADGDQPVSREALVAMAEVLKDAREAFQSEPKKPKRNKPGSPVDAEAALRDLES